MNNKKKTNIKKLGIIAVCLILFVAIVIGVGLQNKSANTADIKKSTAASVPAKSGYANVNGLKMYYEVYGKGKPVVLLHGAFSNINTDFEKIIPGLAKQYQVIAIEQQGHGRTADIDRPLRYAQMADDTAVLLKQLKIKNADLIAYSMGGQIALRVAQSNPELVHKVVFIGGTSYNRDGLYPEALVDVAPEVLEKALKGSPWQVAYHKIAPHPEDWSKFIIKKLDLDKTMTDWTPAELQAIQAPVLLIIGDSDIVKPEHTASMFRLLGGGVPGDIYGLPKAQFAVLPGTTHVTVIYKTDWLLSMIPAFLEASVPTPSVAPTAQ